MKEILKRHKKWLKEEGDWSDKDQASFVSQTINSDILKGADLRLAVFLSCNLAGSVKDADFSESIITGCKFEGIDASGARFNNADLSGSDFSGCILKGANFSGAVTDGCIFDDADLEGAICYEVTDINAFSGAKNMPEIIIRDFDEVPQGDIVSVWKKVRENLIVRLEIPADAKRINIDKTRCKADRVIVKSIEDLDGNPSKKKSVASLHDPGFIYKLGDTISIYSFKEDTSMTDGIYFFMDRKNAEKY